MKTKVLKTWVVVSLLIIGFGGYQFAVIYKSNTELTAENKTLTAEVDNLRLTNKALLADLQEHARLIHRLDADLQTQAKEVRALVVQGARIGWIARDRKGMTIDDLADLIYKK